MIKKISVILIVLFVLTNISFASTPMESIKGPTENIIKILKSDEYKSLTPQLREKQWNEIWAVVDHSFDFDIISRLAVGKHWKRFNDAEKKRFKELFAELLANTYINKLQDNFKNQKIKYVSEKIMDKKAQVYVEVALTDKPVPIIYRLVNKERWLVYDVKIEGLSMIKNYRSQFDEFLFKNKPATLIKRLEKKIKSLRNERAQHGKK